MDDMYKIEWTRKAYKQLTKIGTEKDRKTIFFAVDELKNWPNVQDVKQLKARTDYRLRVGRYRIIFEVGTLLKIIIIEEVKKRDEHTY